MRALAALPVRFPITSMKGKATEDVLREQKKIEHIQDITTTQEFDAEGISEFDQRLRDEKIDGIRGLDEAEFMNKD